MSRKLTSQPPPTPPSTFPLLIAASTSSLSTPAALHSANLCPNGRDTDVSLVQRLQLSKSTLVSALIGFALLMSTLYFTSIHTGANHPAKDYSANIIFNQSKHHTEDKPYFDKSKYHHLKDNHDERSEFNDNNSTLLVSNRTERHMSLIQHRRVKRGVIELASMINCITGCNPLSYKDYGCYCGFQGDGYPVDGIDRCCLMHDLCYERTSCHQALVYFKPYKWTCQGYGRARCAYLFGTSSKSLCGVQLCECDRKFAKCLSRYRCPHSKPDCDITKNIIIGR